MIPQHEVCYVSVIQHHDKNEWLCETDYTQKVQLVYKCYIEQA